MNTHHTTHTETTGFLKPERIIPHLSVKEGMSVADFGCGSGHFTILFAQRVGSSGRVFAFDVMSEALEAVRSRARMLGVANIETARVDLETERATKLPDASVDMVFIGNILFQSQKKEAILKEALRILRSRGVVALIDWKKESPFAPKSGVFPMSKSEARLFAEKAGFVFEKDIDAGEHHFGIIGVKK